MSAGRRLSASLAGRTPRRTCSCGHGSVWPAGYRRCLGWGPLAPPAGANEDAEVNFSRNSESS